MTGVPFFMPENTKRDKSIKHRIVVQATFIFSGSL